MQRIQSNPIIISQPTELLQKCEQLYEFSESVRKQMDTFRQPESSTALQKFLGNRLLGNDELTRLEPADLKPKPTIQDIPAETLVEIATILSPVDRASFALACQHTHGIIGRALRLDHETQYQLLNRLEGDGVLLTDILCSICRTFHPPRRNRAWTAQEGLRDCVKGGAREVLQRSDSPFLPEEVYFDLVAAILRCHRLKSKQYDVNLLGSRRLYGRGNAKARAVVSAKVFDRHLFLKTEIFLFAGTNRASALKNISRLESLLHRHHQLGNICGHTRWANIWTWMFPPHRRRDRSPNPATPSVVQTADLPERDLRTCLWTHERTCWTRCDASSRLETNMTGIWSCRHCATDYKISTLHLENARPETARTKILVLTSWKDLGNGGSVYDAQWQNHLEDAAGRHHTFALSRRYWSPLDCFENGRKGVLTVPYNPRLGSEAIEELLG
ncbi:hypothetical protein QQZ08_001740 [Neonectria magnoliae]|uniref:F-box domain-containing protein n=1 Tax=Neonectria magnoliae TaxID=2732573 RepID=A0ABR1IE10_9HYPO